MKDSEILQQIFLKYLSIEEIAKQVISKPELLPDIFVGLNSDKASIKFDCDKVLRLISEKEPKL